MIGVPQTCEEILVAERRADRWSIEDARAARFAVVSIAGDRARVRLEAPRAASLGF